MAASANSLPVTPAVLRWARAVAHLSQRDAAKQLGITVAELEQLENGQLSVSSKLYPKLLKVYRQTESAMLRPEPPALDAIPRDFRMVRRDGNRRPDLDRSTIEMIREVRRVQHSVSD